MWYFTWVLGLGLACAFAILNALWLEIHLGDAGGEPPGAERPEESQSRS
ncbi:MAG: cytochrome bd-I oxidase subunit CydX [Proteobacteria bacterium]|nr:cytochrome bd-I oxidase subunit CydX [Pseudomonadota bacterium]